MLKIKDLRASIEDKEILKGINLEVKPGEVHAIMGPNGVDRETLENLAESRRAAITALGSWPEDSTPLGAPSQEPPKERTNAAICDTEHSL